MKRQPEPEYMELDDEAQAYADADFSEVNQRFVEALIEKVCHLNPCRALDLGTGPGEIPCRVCSLQPNWFVVGIDASPPMLAIANSSSRQLELTNRCRFVLTDAKQLPIADHSVELVFSNSILHHINDTKQFWSEIKRVLKPQGMLFLRDLARPASPQQAWGLVQTYSGTESDLLKEEFYRSLLAAYTCEEIHQQLDTVGIKECQVEMVSDRHLDVWGIRRY